MKIFSILQPMDKNKPHMCVSVTKLKDIKICIFKKIFEPHAIVQWRQKSEQHKNILKVFKEIIRSTDLLIS